jgi:hypothetical protein
MRRKSSSSKRVDDEMKEVEDAPVSLPEEIEAVEEELEPSRAAEPVALKSETKKIATKQSLWVRVKNSAGTRIRLLSVRPMIWFGIVMLLILLYIVPLSLLQWGNQDKIQIAMKTTTAQALQTASAMPATETPSPMPVP